MQSKDDVAICLIVSKTQILKIRFSISAHDTIDCFTAPCVAVRNDVCFLQLR